MKLKTTLLFAFYTLLFLFYPGDSDLFHTFAFNRNLFSRSATTLTLSKNPYPVINQFVEPVITAESVYIADLPSLTPVYSKNSTQYMLPASTAKIITALVAYDIFKPDNIITVNNTTNDGQVMGLVPGEKITVENLLYGILVHSGNDAAYALADSIGIQKFILLMNQKAQSLHMNNSQFRNPAGLHNPEQYTTAQDLALAGRALLKNKYLSKIVSTKEIQISDVNYRYFHKLVNVNKLLGEIPGVGGLKTGYTIESGEHLISLYKRNDGHEMIIVVLKSTDRFEDTKTLVRWIENNITYEQPSFVTQ